MKPCVKGFKRHAWKWTPVGPPERVGQDVRVPVEGRCKRCGAFQAHDPDDEGAYLWGLAGVPFTR